MAVTAEVFTYHFGETAEMGLDKFRGTPRYYSGYVLSPATKQALLDNQQSRYGDNECRKLNSNADIYLLDLEKDNKRRIGQDKDFIYGMSISPDGKWYTFSRADMPPGCRERETAKEDLNIQHWVVPLPFNRMHPRAKQLSGSFVAWLDTDFLLLQKESVMVLYNLTANSEQALPFSSTTSQIIGVVTVTEN